ncbi:MAG TPA: hypothetical protein VHW01_02745 [Polyangiaceae bacterium]|jgi:hypothetical protein|nr:hypothetical protein [Polyangiaceae bacterium]
MSAKHYGCVSRWCGTTSATRWAAANSDVFSPAEHRREDNGVITMRAEKGSSAEVSEQPKGGGKLKMAPSGGL